MSNVVLHQSAPMQTEQDEQDEQLINELVNIFSMSPDLSDSHTVKLKNSPNSKEARGMRGLIEKESKTRGIPTKEYFVELMVKNLKINPELEWIVYLRSYGTPICILAAQKVYKKIVLPLTSNPTKYVFPSVSFSPDELTVVTLFTFGYEELNSKPEGQLFKIVNNYNPQKNSRFAGYLYRALYFIILNKTLDCFYRNYSSNPMRLLCQANKKSVMNGLRPSEEEQNIWLAVECFKLHYAPNKPKNFDYKNYNCAELTNITHEFNSRATGCSINENTMRNYLEKAIEAIKQSKLPVVLKSIDNKSNDGEEQEPDKEFPAPNLSPEEMILEEELLSSLGELLSDKLFSAAQRQVLKMRFSKELNYSEISNLTGKKEGNCRTIESRALDKLIQIVNKNPYLTEDIPAEQFVETLLTVFARFH